MDERLVFCSSSHAGGGGEPSSSSGPVAAVRSYWNRAHHHAPSRRSRVVAASAAAAGAAAVLIAVAVAVGLAARPRPPPPPPPPSQAARPPPLRLVTAFEPGGALDADALTALPDDLRAAARGARLSSSGLQILTLKSEGQLIEAWRHLSAQPGLRLLVRDFAVSGPLGVQKQGPAAPPTRRPPPTKEGGEAVAVEDKGWWVAANADDADPPSSRRKRQLLSAAAGQEQEAAANGTTTNTTTNIATDPDYALAAAAAGAADAAHDRSLVSRAWRLTRGSSRVLVAHVDTGVDLGAFEGDDLSGSPFRGRLWSNPLEASGAPGVDDDDNGYDDDVGGVAFLGRCVGDTYDGRGYCMECGPTGDLSDLVGHGTHTAGIIAARPEEEVEAQRRGDFAGRSAGLSAAAAREWAAGGGGNASSSSPLPRPAPRGVAPGARLLPLKVSDCADGVIWASGVFRAFDYALNAGAQIVSCSFSAVFPDGFGAQNLTMPSSGDGGGEAGGGGGTTTTGGSIGGSGPTSPPVAGASSSSSSSAGAAAVASAATNSSSGGGGETSTSAAPPTPPMAPTLTPPAPASERDWARAYSAALAPLARAGVLVVAAAGNNRVDLDRLSALGYTDYPCFGQEPGLTAARAVAALERGGAAAPGGGGGGGGGGLGGQANSSSQATSSSRQNTAPLDGAAAANGSSLAPVGGGAAAGAAAAAASADGDADGSSSLAALYWSSGSGAPPPATTTPTTNSAGNFFEGSAGFPNVICVGAIADADEVPPGGSVDPSLVAAPYSNFGRRSVALAAPGTVGSTRAGGGYGVQRGTSMAAPLVSGTAALALSVLGALTGNYTGRAAELRAALLAGALPMPAPPPALRRQALAAVAAAAATAAGNGTDTNGTAAAASNATTTTGGSSSDGTKNNGTAATAPASSPALAFPMTGAAVDSAEPPFGARLDAEAAIRWIVDRYAPPGMLTARPLVPLGGAGEDGLLLGEAGALGNSSSGSSSSSAAAAGGAAAEAEGDADLPGVLRTGGEGAASTSSSLRSSSTTRSSKRGRVLALRGFTERMEHPSASEGLAAEGGGGDGAAALLAAREQRASAPGSVRQAALPMGGLNLDGWGDPSPDATVVVAARVVLPEPGIWVFRAGTVTRPPMLPPGQGPPPPPDGAPPPPPPPGALSRAVVRVNGRPTAARAAPQPGPPALSYNTAQQQPSSSSSPSRVAAGDGVEGVFVASEPGLFSLELALPAADGAAAASLDLFVRSPSGGGFVRLSPGGSGPSGQAAAGLALSSARTARGQDPAAAPVPLAALAPKSERDAAADAALSFWRKELAFSSSLSAASSNSSSTSTDPPSPHANATTASFSPSFAVYYNWTTLPDAQQDPRMRPMLSPSFEGMAAGALAVRRSPRSATVDLPVELPTYTQVKLADKLEWTAAADFQRFLDPDKASAAAGGPFPPSPPLVLARGVAVGAFELPPTDSGVALVSFRALCRGCALAVDGQLVLDAWATAGTPEGANTRGDCVALATGRRSLDGAEAEEEKVQHTVALAFAPPPTADGRTLNAPLALSIAPCGGGGGRGEAGGREAGAALALASALPRVLAGALTPGEAALVAAGPAVPVGATLASFRPLEANATAVVF